MLAASQVLKLLTVQLPGKATHDPMTMCSFATRLRSLVVARPPTTAPTPKAPSSSP